MIALMMALALVAGASTVAQEKSGKAKETSDKAKETSDKDKEAPEAKEAEAKARQTRGAQARRATSAPDKRLIDSIIRAEKAESKGNVAEAVRTYEEVRKATEGRPELLRVHADAVLRSARAVEVKDVAAARAGYETVIRTGEPDQKLAARNALGVMLLRKGDAQAAVRELTQIDMATVRPEHAFVFRSNLGRAHEAAGQLEAAVVEYRKALDQQPTWTAAQEGAFRALSRRTPIPVADGLALVDLLSKKGQARAAVEGLRRLLVAWSADPAALDLLPALPSAYVDARVGITDFREREWPELRKAMGGPIGPALRQLARVYVGEMEVARSSGEARQMLSEWASPHPRASAMARLLRFTCGLQDAAAQPKRALAACWASWLMDPQNPEGAVETVALLDGHADLQAGFPFVLGQLVETLFEAKGAAYRDQDWPQILALHVVLAGMFERQGEWGANRSPRGALFQWEHAAEAERQVRRLDAKMGSSPGLHQSLANCYRVVGRPQDAWPQFLEAAEAFLADGRPQEAAKALAETRSLGIAPDAAMGLRVRAIEAKIQAGRSPGD